MQLRDRSRGLGGFSITLMLVWSSLVSAQSFSSGSTGALGAFTPTTTTTVPLPPDGILHYTTVSIPAGVTITFTPNVANTPVTLLATGDITIAGTLDVSGSSGPPMSVLETPGGPGGFPGGVGGSPPTGGAGPGGGAPTGSGTSNATYGAPAAFVTALPLFGGSGGGGGLASSLGATGGGGGGGAIVLASSTQIRVPGTILAVGGDGGQSPAGTGFTAGGGSGGALRLVAPQLTGTGQLFATGGAGTGTLVSAGAGLIRLEATTLGFTGTSQPPASTSTTPGPVTPASRPPLVNLPTLTITAIGDLAAPASPTGSLTTADVVLPQGTSTPVTVTLTATALPVPTPFTVQVIPPLGSPLTVSGTFTSATATVPVALPLGQVSQLLAFASFTVPAQTAGLWPLIDGEPVEQVRVATRRGGPSTVTLITRSGRTAPAEALRLTRWALPEGRPGLNTRAGGDGRTR